MMSDFTQSADRVMLNLVGEQVALGPLRRDLLPLYLKWINDFEVTRTLDLSPRPWTWEAEQEWFDRASRDDHDVHFTIYERDSLRPIGSTGLRHIDPVHGTAEFGIMIGERDCWGRGYGTEATRLVLGYAFHTLGLHNIMLRVFSGNERAIRAYLRAGFRIIGRRREARRQGAARQDVVYMDCLSTELLARSPEPGGLPAPPPEAGRQEPAT